MIGTLPVSQLAPLEYRYALDAALALLLASSEQLPAAPATTASIRVCCDVAQLQREIEQRLEDAAPTHPRAGLWVEPQVASWRADLAHFAAMLAPGAPLIIIAARPPAQLLPERRGWGDDPLGIQFGGLRRLERALADHGFTLREHHGLHTLGAIGLNALSSVAERFGRLDLADRLHFAGRLRYRSSGVPAALSTLALLVARRG